MNATQDQTPSQPQVGISAELAAIIAAQDEYIELLGDELNELYAIALNHRWVSSRYQAGWDARSKIAHLKAQAANT